MTIELLKYKEDLQITNVFMLIQNKIFFLVYTNQKFDSFFFR
jgi:hypothetical protein